MGATAGAGAALPEDAKGAPGAAGAGTASAVVITGAGSAGAPRTTSTSTSMAAMVWKTNAVTFRTTGTASQEDRDEKQASIILPSPKANLSKELYNNPTDEQRGLAAQFHDFFLQDSPDLTHLNDAGKRPVVGIINIPKSITIRVLHSFGVGTNPIG